MKKPTLHNRFVVLVVQFSKRDYTQPKRAVSVIILLFQKGVKTIADYFNENDYDTAYIGKWHLASDGELEEEPTIDYTTSAIPPERRGGYKGFWRASDVLEFTSHGYDG
ncbi:TPA: hypothetical protein ACY37S_001552 [Pasteurella multocida]